MAQTSRSDRDFVGDVAMLPGRAWSSTHGMYIAGRAYVDEADLTACQMEAKWGADRLRLLVGPELREKFDRQRYLLNQAICHGDLERVRREALRMVKAWLALDQAATHAGAKPLDPNVWEIALSDGSVAAVVPDNHQAHRVIAEGRNVNVYTLEEIGRLIEGYPGLARVKLAFPGAKVTTVHRNLADPLEALEDLSKPLDQPWIEDEIPW